MSHPTVRPFSGLFFRYYLAISKNMHMRAGQCHAAFHDRRSRPLSPPQGTQNLRNGGRRDGALHQGHRPLAVPQGRTRSLAGLQRHAAGGHDAAGAGAHRRRQSRPAAGMGVARERLRPRHARGRQRSRLQPLHRRRDHRRRHASACLRRSGGRCQYRRRCRPQRFAGRRADRVLPPRAGSACWRPAIRSRSAPSRT